MTRKSAVLIVLAMLVLVIGGVVYLTVKSYEANKRSQLRTENLLTEQQSEIKTLKNQVIGLQNSSSTSSSTQKETFIQKAQRSGIKPGWFKIISLPKNQSQDPNISAQDITRYLGGIVQVTCGQVEGSGSLWNLNGRYYVLTNQHVIEAPNCFFNLDADSYNAYNAIGTYKLKIPGQSWNTQTDSYIAEIGAPVPVQTLNNIPDNTPEISNLNYSIGFLRKCDAKLPKETPVAVVGYPAYGDSQVTINGYTGMVSHQIVTDGKISGYDDTVEINGNLPDVNYFVTAKMDAGNSGGIAIAKDGNGLCLLGLPTWVSQGVYTNTGMVQSINNVMYQSPTTGTAGTTSTDTTPVVVVPAGTGLVVSLAADTPAAKTLGSGTAFNPALKVNLTAGATAVNVTGVALLKTGFLSNTNLNGVDIVDASGVRHGNVVTSVNADNTVSITFPSAPITVPAGQSTSFTVRFNLLTGSYTGTVSFGVAAASSLTADTTSISGSFPITGSLMQIVNGGSSF